MPEPSIKRLARRQLDERLTNIRASAALFDRPRSGWIGAIRQALRMPQTHLAERMNVSRQAISQLEQREVDGSVTIRALEQAAEALGGRLIYAVVPDRPLEQMLSDRAMERAQLITETVRHTMRLENQEPNSDLEQRTRDIAEELLETPSRLWAPDEGR